MKGKILIRGFLLALLLALVCVSFALAADDPLKVSMRLSANTFSEPKDITVTISVTNVGESDLPGPATLYYPSGRQVDDFGSPTLTVGTTKTWEGTWKVTKNELEAGRITFKLKYTLYDDAGQLVNKTKNFSKSIIWSNAEPELKIERVIKPTTARKGQEVTITYNLKNTGTSDVSSVRIQEKASKTAGTIASIPAGEEASYTFTPVMDKKDITSSATVTFNSGKKTYKQTVEAAVIKYGEVKLSATLTTDKKGGAPGDTVKLTVKLKNSGNVDFTDVALTDENLGEAFSGVKVPAGEPVTLEKYMVVSETQDIQFTVTGDNGTGEPVETATGKVNVIATDPTQQVVLSIEASADRDRVYTIPGNVRFTITVRNDSAVEVKNISVRAVNTVVNSFDAIPAGESRTFTREMAVSMPGSFQFTANCRDQLSQNLSFRSNVIQIAQADLTPEPTLVPIPTPKPLVTEPVPESYEELDESQKLPAFYSEVTGYAKNLQWVFGGIAAVLGTLLLIGFIRRTLRKNQQKKTMGQLEESSYRDYSAEPKRNKRSEITDNLPENAPADAEEPENTAQDSGLMAETLERLYRQPAQDTEEKTVDAVLPMEEAPTADTGDQTEAIEEGAAEGEAMLPLQPAEADEPTEAIPEEPASVMEASHRRRRKE